MNKLPYELIKMYQTSLPNTGFTVLVENGKIKPYDKKIGRYRVSYKTIITINEISGDDFIQYTGERIKDGVYGGWYDDAEAKFYIEANKTFNDVAEAVAFALRHKQKAYYDIVKEEVVLIPTVNISHSYFDADVHAHWKRNKTRYLRKFKNMQTNKSCISIISDMSDLQNLGKYNLDTGRIEVNWHAIKFLANFNHVPVEQIITGVISHETMHYILHRDEGLETTFLFDAIAGVLNWARVDEMRAGMPLSRPKKGK